MTSPYGGAVGDARKRITDNALLGESLRERHRALIEANLARRAEVAAALQAMTDHLVPASLVVDFEADPIGAKLAEASARATPCSCSAQRARAEAAETEVAALRRQVADLTAERDAGRRAGEAPSLSAFIERTAKRALARAEAAERTVAAQAETVAQWRSDLQVLAHDMDRGWKHVRDGADAPVLIDRFLDEHTGALAELRDLVAPQREEQGE